MYATAHLNAVRGRIVVRERVLEAAGQLAWLSLNRWMYSPEEKYVIWTTIKRWALGESSGDDLRREALTERRSVAPKDAAESAGVAELAPTARYLEVEGTCLRAGSGTSERARRWRRRALLRKGARLYSSIAATRNFVSLAMLDADGIVVAWYEHAGDRDPVGDDSFVHGHVSQLYMPEDVALGLPVRDLCNATLCGSSTQVGWRRGRDGAAVWASIVIRPIFLGDGRLQGFSHLTHRRPVPWRDPQLPSLWSFSWLPGRTSKKAVLNRTGMARLGTILSRRRPGLNAIIHTAALIAALLTFGAPGLVTAADVPPDHSVPSAYGSRWECMHGYRRVAEACREISLPKNAYLDASGDRWRCNRGYLNVNDACVAIRVPAIAYLDDSYGTGWRCDRGYREAKGVCVAIQIPDNAHEVDSSFGAGWQCNRGYLLRSGKCAALNVPVHAYLTRNGDDWKCDRGFVKAAAQCMAVAVPANAHLEAQGDAWACNRGYQKVNAECKVVQLPPNSHLDYAGDSWKCNRGFVENAGACVEG